MSRHLLAILSALMAALMYASSSVMQHRVARSVDASTGPVGLIRRLVASKWWVVAKLIGLVAVGFQAVALSQGSLIVVQSVLTSAVVFALVLEARAAHRWPTIAQCSGSLLIIVGVVLIVGLAHPHGNRTHATDLAWAIASGSVTVLCALIMWASHSDQLAPAGQGRVLAAGAGVAFGLDAAFLKTASTSGYTVAAWLGLAGFFTLAGIGNVLIQRAFHITHLASTLPTLTAVETMASVVFGVLLFHERFSRSEVRDTAGALGFVLLAVGVLVSTRPHPGDLSLVSVQP